MSIKKKLKLFGGYFFRWIGFSVEPDVIKVGNPTTESLVFLTCNFNITVKRVLKALKGLNCYLLIAPSKGINVWCGACGDDFHTDSILSIIKTSRINELVSHRTLILPQLSAPGIDPVTIKKKTGWNVKFGPVYAKDIPEYIKNNCQKTEEQRKIRFPLSKRAEMANLYFFMLFLFFTGIYWIVSIFLKFIDLILYVNSTIIIIVIIYGSLIILPSISTKTGKIKVLIYELIIISTMIILFIFQIYNIFFLVWSIILSSLIALIVAEDFNGLTPTYKSELGERSWNKGNETFKSLFGRFKLQPYGQIILERDKCIGCSVCIDVCPRNLYSLNVEDKKVDIHKHEKCINCNACVKRCLAQCLTIS
jgi:NAD-dependent dihydropyrimidine dehydrogenase PreA subunit